MGAECGLEDVHDELHSIVQLQSALKEGFSTGRKFCNWLIG